MKPKRVLHWLEGKIVYSLGFGAAFLLLTGAVLLYFSGALTSSAQVVRIAYGSGDPVRKQFIDEMAIHGKRRHLDIRLVTTDGTDQTLSLIDQNVVDLGLITSAVEDQASRDVFEVAPLYMEPLQLLVREKLYDSISKDFGQLRGKSIGVDGQNSATNLLATELLRFIGLTDPATGKLQYQPVYLPQSHYTDLKDSSSLPDAIFQIAGIPSPGIRSLIAGQNYRLVALPFSGSFTLDRFRQAVTPDSGQGSNLRLNKAFIEESIIPAFAYSVLPAVPATDTRTIATRLILAGSQKLDNATVRKILELVLSPEISSLAKPALSIELLNSSYQFDRHPGTDKYLSDLKPFDVEGAFDTYGRLVEVWGLIISLYFAAAKALKVWRRPKVDVRKGAVGDFLKQVLAVEAEARVPCSEENRILLDQRLSDIKKASVELQLEGLLEDPENFPSLLVVLADTRAKIWGPAF